MANITLHPEPQDADHDSERILRALVEGTAAVTGAEFFRALVRNLAEALAVRYAFVSEFTAVRTRVRTLSFWSRDGFFDNVEYDLAHTPCEAVLCGEIRHYPRDIQKLFPKEKELVEMEAESYLAIPLIDTQGEVLGHLAVIDDKPMPSSSRDLSIFRIFAARATAELQRERMEQKLADSEKWLSTILASAMDAVITLDEYRHIILFNDAAAKIFRCSADWAMGKPFDRFLSPRFRNLLADYMRALPASDEGKRPLWVPEGLTALRADDEEFPIETTVSPMCVAGKTYYTMILRDIDERKHAEQTLHRLQWENRYLQEQIEGEYTLNSIPGDSAAMRDVVGKLAKVAGTDSTVLLLGETGTGKELLARAIHQHSARRDRMLVIVNCAALPAELIESELFGHEKGAFTGATSQRKGRFELADGSTLFLDEVGELSLTAQAKLLRVLQQQEFERVGGATTLKVNVRVIAATNRDLAEMVKEATFRTDLFYRLNVFPVRVPPLRERISDIPVLVNHFLHHFGRKLGKSLGVVSPYSMERLLSYSWPGNIRELQNVIERAAILSPGPVVDIDEALDLRLEVPGEAEPVTGALTGTLEEVERRYIKQVLAANGWVIEGARGAAAKLGLRPSTLRFRMQKLGIKKP